MNTMQSTLRQPLLGTLTLEQMRNALLSAIADEATAVKFYTSLLQEAPNELHYQFIEHARDDELIHLNYFTKLYKQIFGEAPWYEVKTVEYADYQVGIQMALQDELAAGEFYRDIQLSVLDQLVKAVFYYAMVDELEHATQFSVLLN